MLSQVTKNSFKSIVEDNLKEKLSNRPYSLIIDNSTFGGVNVCVLKVKYLEKRMEWRVSIKFKNS